MTKQPTLTEGRTYYGVTVYGGRVEIFEYVCRTVNCNGAYLTAKIKGVTWVNKGWSKSIPDWCRQQVLPNSKHNFRLTQVAAVKAQLASDRASFRAFKNDEDASDIEVYKKWLARRGLRG